MLICWTELLPAALDELPPLRLYRTDLARLDQIKEFMRGQGHRNLSDSEALRLACRAFKISEEFLRLTIFGRSDGFAC